MIIINSLLLEVTRGDKKADLVLKNAKLIDVFNEKLYKDDLAIYDGIIAGIGDYEGKEVIDLEGKIISPSFIDGHLHLESAMVSVKEFAKKVISLGTTTIVADPHEIANVNGLKGIEFLLNEGKNLPWNFNMMLPSCVPSSKFETNGAILEAKDLEKLKNRENVFGLGEVMDYPGVVNGDKELWEKLDLFSDKFIDGHSPGLKGKKLNAYLQGKIRADHECTTAKEALEKLRKGMYIMIREGSVTRDLKALIPAINENNFNRFLFATDDRHPGDILREGHINFLIKKAIKEGLDPIKAIKLASFNSAQAFNFNNLGAIAPGYKADLVLLDNFKDLKVEKVFKDGKIVAEKGRAIFNLENNKEKEKNFQEIYNSINLAKVNKEKFELPQGKKYRVMNLVEDQIITKKSQVNFEKSPVTNQDLINKDLVKLAVVERHKKTGNIGLGLLGGLGLNEGAIATSVGHDSHNIMVVGLDKEDMLLAVNELKKLNGGIVIVNNGKVLDSLALEIAGLMSKKSIEDVSKKLKSLRNEAKKLGVKRDNPFMTISFMALPVIPRLKVTDRGLFSAEDFDFVSLVIE
ncbi:MAG: adenine deaminase [Halanaerobiales bacterium]